MEERGRRRESARKRDVTIETESERCHTADFKDREMALSAKKCGWPLEAPRGKEIDSLLEPI